MINENTLLMTDVYKLGHMRMYAPGTTGVYSYLQARSSRYFNECLWFGLSYYLNQYLKWPIGYGDMDEFLDVYRDLLGCDTPLDVQLKIESLVEIGRWPVQIHAVPEGTVVNNGNVLMTIQNTLPGFHWCVGFIESLLLKVWYPCSVATTCLQYRKVLGKAMLETGSTLEEATNPSFMVHDFGYRGDASEEGAAISGAAHLTCFRGSDTIPALKFIDAYYTGNAPLMPCEIMASVPASEHSVMCSYGRDNEFGAFERLIDMHPGGIVSIVSDTFNIWEVLSDFMPRLKEKILARNGKVVIRPDSGDPEKIICGNPDSTVEAERLGCLEMLGKVFGTTNRNGYKVLNEKVGLIYGDGMYLERYKKILEHMRNDGWAATNLVIGVGGILRNHTRDTLGFAIKATCVEQGGEWIPVKKDPVTDPGKRSHTGFLCLSMREDGEYETRQVSDEHERGSLVQVFRDGIVEEDPTIFLIRNRVNEYVRRYLTSISEEVVRCGTH